MSKAKTETQPKVVSFSKTNTASLQSKEEPKSKKEASTAKPTPAAKSTAEKSTVAKSAIVEKTQEKIAKGEYPFYLKRLNSLMAKNAGFKRSEASAITDYESYLTFLADKKIAKETIEATLVEFFNYKG